MRTRTASVFVFALLAALPGLAGTFTPAPQNGVPDVYIVVLADGVAGKSGARPGLPSVADVAQSLGRTYQGAVTEVWEAALHGFVIRMPEARARRLAEDPRVLSVEQNLFISAPVGDCYYGTPWQDTRPLPSSTSSPQTLSCADPEPLNDSGAGAPACRDNWGLDRIDQWYTTRNNLYYFPNNATNVHVYVLDTGIRWAHREFLNANGVSRVSGGVDARTNPVTPGNSTNTDDCYGHGTHVAGIVAGRTYGVAKNALVHPVRTIGCPTDPLSNQQFIDNTIRGLDWIVSEVVSRRSSQAWPAVVNWSGGNHTLYSGSTSLRTAVRNLVDNNIVLVQAAGNQSPEYELDPSVLRDACQWSFGGSVPKVIVAGGSDYNDGRWARRPAIDPDDARYCGSDCGSNVGSCIDIWSPAAHVIASNRGGNDLACRLSGTSMAAPHVAGVAALYLSVNPWATPEQVDRALRSNGRWNVLQSSGWSRNYIGRDSDNVLLYNDTTSIGDTAPVAAFNVNCPGRQCVFDGAPSTDDTGSLWYTWQLGEFATGSGQVVRWDFPANYTGEVVLKVTDMTGKTDHLVKTITVNADAPPTASFTVSCTATTCTFDASASTDDQSIASRVWKFGDNTTDSGTVVTHTYAAGGSYLVNLTVTDNVGQIGIKEQSVTVTALSAPTGVVAAASGGNVTVTWNTVSGADGYDVERKISSAAWQLAQSVSGGSTSSAVDVPPTTNGAVVLYRVKARAGSGSSQPSNNDVAYAASFSNDPPVAGTPIRAEHVTEVRRAINNLRDIGGQGPLYSTSDLDPNVLRGTPVDDAEFLALMNNLNAARSLVSLPAAGFRVVPSEGAPIRSTQIEDLRLGFK